MRRKNGFTLIELLVVVAIIALLIAILLPSLGKARKLANTSRCLANSRSISTALKTYMSDWNSLLPYVSSSNTAYVTTYWIALAESYGKVTQKARTCPEAMLPNVALNSLGSADTPWYAPGSKTEFGAGAYGLNGWLFSLNGYDGQKMLTNSIATDSAGAALPAASFWRWPVPKAEASIPLVGDSAYTVAWPNMNDPAPTSLQGPTFNSPAETVSTKDKQMHRFVVNRHSKTVTMGFVDGHAESVKLGALWTLNWNAAWSMTTPMTMPAQ